ncbi:flavodoxin family protein [Nocardia sp. NPDC020380]|uniref:flavodoxin family protein n=1 Tax=Nocardia sp. NPDC020380 TaxID=3364309 RepID=UPI003799BA06
MKTIIVCTSVSHGNTRKVADVIGQVLQARVVAPGQISPAELTGYDLVGFGSGIFLGKFHKELREFVEALPQVRATKAFVFATSGFPEKPAKPYTNLLAKPLEQKGFEVVDTFTTRGFDTFAPFKLVGGLQKGHPDADDLLTAQAFAEGLRTRIGIRS